MGLIFRKRIRLGAGTGLNLSRRGASVSKRVGPVTLNTRGRGRIRLGKGLSFRFKI
jgi:uncharacterized protein DUF4236